ncbi:MAG: nuclear transport factor 2 family protein [Herminiimonas sp.]|nr:nuclear transport factor 2 family protein [Herminiimonas sp.]
MPDFYTAQFIVDRMEIQDVIHRWCRAIDRRDFASIYECFHPNGYDDHIFYRGDIDGLVSCLKERHCTISFSVHALSNVLIEFASSDLAVVESYVKVVQRRPILAGSDSLTPHVDDSNVSEVFCRYLDKFEKRNGRWKIASRTLVIDSAIEFSDKEPLYRIPDMASANRGQRDLTDALYALRKHHGIDN